MQWYYANNNQRQGPVSESEFARLAATGIISADTLVWRQGMAGWQPYSEIAPPPPLPGMVPPAVESGLAPFSSSAAAALSAVADAPPRLHYAGFWIRVLAKLIDWVILYVISLGITSAMHMNSFDFMTFAQSGNVDEMLPAVMQLGRLALVDAAMRLAFYWFFLARFAATPGKLALGLRVVRPDRQPLSQGQIVGRFFAEVVTKYFTLCIGYVVAGFDDEKRTLHDHLAGTRVVKTRS